MSFHDAIQTTMIYAHLAPGDKRQAAKVIEKYIHMAWRPPPWEGGGQASS